jgi:pYEATS domain-containing protein involved in immunity
MNLFGWHLRRVRGRGGDRNGALDPFLGSPGRQTERAIGVLMTIGLASLAVIIISGLMNGGGVRFVIWAIIAALSATLVGGALGLLFGLPTSQIGPAPTVVVQTAPSQGQGNAAPATPLADQPQGTTPAQPLTAAAPTPGGPVATASSSDRRDLDIGYRDSTSLEQVADWLTKIIVGLTLTQFSSWEVRFEAIARNLTEAMAGPLGRSIECAQLVAPLSGTPRLTALASPLCQIPPASAVPGGMLIALGATIGFLVSYLWMRRYFILEMVVAKKVAGDFLNVREAKAKSDVAAQTEQQIKSELVAAQAAAAKLQADFDLAQAEARRRQAELEAEISTKQAELAAERAAVETRIESARSKGLAPSAASPMTAPAVSASQIRQILMKGQQLLPADSAGLAALIEISQSMADSHPDPEDPWRGKFGTSQANDTALEASISITPDPATFQIDLAVRGQTPERIEALVGTKAIYYLHPTFGHDPRVSTFGVDGRAPLELFAWGAFTVGVVLEDGTKLELNLATLEGAPDQFRIR